MPASPSPTFRDQYRILNSLVSSYLPTVLRKDGPASPQDTFRHQEGLGTLLSLLPRLDSPSKQLVPQSELSPDLFSFPLLRKHKTEFITP